MKRKKLYLFWGLLVMLAAGCGRPVQAVPTVDSSPRETALAGTALAAFGTATPTPSPTETPVPTPKISVYGTSLVTQQDGSVLFVDHTAGIQVTFPAYWLVMRVGEPEYYAAWEKPSMQNASFQDVFASLNNIDPKVLRVIALDTREGHMPGGLVSAINIVFLEGDNRSLEETEKARRTKSNLCADFKFISSSYSETDNGVRILVTEERCKVVEGTVSYRDAYFNVPSGKFHVRFETNFDYKDASLPDFEQVINSLTMLNP